jgi:hypothetical protein
VGSFAFISLALLAFLVLNAAVLFPACRSLLQAGPEAAANDFPMLPPRLLTQVRAG